MIQVVVRRHRGKWIVKTRELERSFANEVAALQSAVQFAHESGKNGSPAVVVMQEDKTKFKDVWTYGKDTYPFKMTRRRKSRTSGRTVTPEIVVPELVAETT
jgi:hypothetical protein